VTAFQLSRGRVDTLDGRRLISRHWPLRSVYERDVHLQQSDRCYYLSPSSTPHIMTQTSVVYRPSVFSIPISSPGPIDCDSVGDVHKLRSDVGIHVQLNNQECNPQKMVACIMHRVNLY
jgi:hypothetical protein